jgi:hypothetical protein
VRQLRRWATRVLVGSVLVTGTCRPAVGEEELLKEGGKYLGWQRQKTEFLTCDKDVIEIGAGRVQQTALKCAGKGRGPMAWLNGKVEFVDQENSTVRIEDVKGNFHKFFVPLGSQQAMWSLQKGDKVSVSVGQVPGRAESIVKTGQ